MPNYQWQNEDLYLPMFEIVMIHPIHSKADSFYPDLIYFGTVGNIAMAFYCLVSKQSFKEEMMMSAS